MATQPTDPTKKAASKKASAKKASSKKASPKKASAKKTAAKKAPAATPAPTPQPASPPSPPPPPQPAPEPVASLANLPIVLFGAALGLAGFAAAWREAAVVYGSGGVVAHLMTGVAVGVFAILVLLYALKAKRHPDAVVKDFKHPVTSNFFAVPTITLILLSSNIIDAMPKTAFLLWAIGSVTNIAITVAILTYWIRRDCDISHAAPVWFIPIVGNLIIPTMAASLGYAMIGWMVLGFAVFFWIALFTIVLYRLLFSKPLEAPLKPTVAIFLAPPSLAFIDYFVLNGGKLDGMAHMLMGICLFTLIFLLPRVPDLLRLPFSLAWWSYTFPLAAFAFACTLYADASGYGAMHMLAICMMAILTVIVLIISAKTLQLVATGALLKPPASPPSSSA